MIHQFEAYTEYETYVIARAFGGSLLTGLDYTDFSFSATTESGIIDFGLESQFKVTEVDAVNMPGIYAVKVSPLLFPPDSTITVQIEITGGDTYFLNGQTGLRDSMKDIIGFAGEKNVRYSCGQYTDNEIVSTVIKSYRTAADAQLDAVPRKAIAVEDGVYTGGNLSDLLCTEAPIINCLDIQGNKIITPDATYVSWVGKKIQVSVFGETYCTTIIDVPTTGPPSVVVDMNITSSLKEDILNIIGSGGNDYVVFSEGESASGTAEHRISSGLEYLEQLENEYTDGEYVFYLNGVFSTDALSVVIEQSASVATIGTVSTLDVEGAGDPCTTDSDCIAPLKCSFGACVSTGIGGGGGGQADGCDVWRVKQPHAVIIGG